MNDPLSFSVDVVYEDAGDGWTMASIPQVPGAFSQGRTRAEARENVADALRELLLARSICRQLDIPVPAPRNPR